jgi:hypothetical protein
MLPATTASPPLTYRNKPAVVVRGQDIGAAPLIWKTQLDHLLSKPHADLDLLSVLHSYGLALFDNGQHEMAVSALEQARELYVKVFGPESLEISQCLMDLCDAKIMAKDPYGAKVIKLF